MIKIYSDPLLLDYLKIAYAMPDDERAQLEAFTGHPYTVDGAAVGNFVMQGPKWVMKDGDEPLAVGGFKMERQGVYRDYLLTTPSVWQARYWRTLTKTCKRLMDGMFEDGHAHRIECIAPMSRLAQRPEIERWYAVMGYEREGVRRGYCANGEDAVAFARVV